MWIEKYITLQVLLLTINKLLYVQKKKSLSRKEKERADNDDIDKTIYLVTKNIDNVNCLDFYVNII